MKIAIIGMAGRFPGASTIDQFWNVLAQGKETIKTFHKEELIQKGLPQPLIDNPYFVPRRGVLDDVECFDASFFSYSPGEAELIDPQQRLFLECAWMAIEDAGYHPKKCDRSVGVFAGANQNTYQLFHVLKDDNMLTKAHELAMYSDKDFLATRVSYKLNLYGPSITVQSACSTSLVCIHLACQSLLSMECDMALAGGVSIVFPQTGYFYQEGGVFSPDGHCRAFDHKANGTLGSDGVGVVFLKRFEDAIRDNDPIYALILGTATNNDGIEKSSFAAPSVDGQVRVIEEALTIAEVEGDTIGYVEGHGTGTILGDLIEMTALGKVFKSHGCKNNSRLIGSLKPNIGHLDQASGVANLIKGALVLKHAMIPPSLYFEAFNTEIGLNPFTVNTKLRPFEKTTYPRRVGVSSFGFGGTNAHVILEQAPDGNSVKIRSPMVPRSFAKTKYFIPARHIQLSTEDTLLEESKTQYDRPAMANHFVPPQSKIETILVGIWEKHLGILNIGIEDDFFELGGHSLLATQVIASIKENYPIEFEIHEVMDYPTISKMAVSIEERLVEMIHSMSEEKAEQFLKELQ
jgi:acyl transferase domain-containing protein/acyl carrier protein